MHANLVKFFNILALSLCLALPGTAWSSGAIDETPSALVMTGDALVVRPVMGVITLVGTGIFIVSSPFSALGGNIGEAWDVLVETPFKSTFVRCLGCTQSGRKESDVIEQSGE